MHIYDQGEMIIGEALLVLFFMCLLRSMYRPIANKAAIRACLVCTALAAGGHFIEAFYYGHYSSHIVSVLIRILTGMIGAAVGLSYSVIYGSRRDQRERDNGETSQQAVLETYSYSRFNRKRRYRTESERPSTEVDRLASPETRPDPAGHVSDFDPPTVSLQAPRP
jgi:hypothetical protein